MKRRKPRAGTVARSPEAFGLGHALMHGGFHSAFYQCAASGGEKDPEKPYPMELLRAAWRQHRAHVLDMWNMHEPNLCPCWAELVFDQGMPTDEAERYVEQHRRYPPGFGPPEEGV